jgi:putative oxidoreductase
MNSVATVVARIAPLVRLFISLSFVHTRQNPCFVWLNRVFEPSKHVLRPQLPPTSSNSSGAIESYRREILVAGVSARKVTFPQSDGISHQERKGAFVQMSNLKLSSLAEAALERVSSFDWLACLLVRLFVGYFFFETGWAKLHNLDAFTTRFAQWGIPHPAFNAALSAYTECIGGALTVAGLATRLVSIPMIVNMAVAIITVKMKSVAGINDFVELDEPLYALSFLWLFASGPGWVSIDHLIRTAILSTSASALDPARQTHLEPAETRIVGITGADDQRT